MFIKTSTAALAGTTVELARPSRTRCAAGPNSISWPLPYRSSADWGWHSSLGGGFYIRLYIFLAFPSRPCPARYPSSPLLHCKSVIMPSPSCDYFQPSLTHARRDMNVQNQSHTCPAAVRAQQHVHAIIFLRWHTERRWTHANFRGLRFCNGQQPAARPGEFLLSGSSSL